MEIEKMSESQIKKHLKDLSKKKYQEKKEVSEKLQNLYEKYKDVRYIVHIRSEQNINFGEVTNVKLDEISKSLRITFNCYLTYVTPWTNYLRSITYTENCIFNVADDYNIRIITEETFNQLKEELNLIKIYFEDKFNKINRIINESTKETGK